MLLGAITPLATFTYVIGSAIILYSLKELIQQNKLFIASMIAFFVEFFLSMANMIIQVLFPLIAGAAYVSLTLSVINTIACAILITAIYLLARAVELPSLQGKIIVTYVFLGIYFIAMLLLNFVFNKSQFAIERLSVIVTISQLLYVIMILVVVANSYIRICYEDDRDMTKKSSSAPLNFLNDTLDRAMTPKEKREGRDNKGDKRK